MSRLCLEVLPNCIDTLSCITSCLFNERKNPVLLAFAAFSIIVCRNGDATYHRLSAGHEPGAKPSPPTPLMLAVRQ